MIELTSETVRLAAAVLYASGFLAGLAGTRFVRPDLRRYCYPLVAVLAVEAGSLVAQASAVGVVRIDGATVNVIQDVSDIGLLAVIYSGVTLLGGASRRLTALTAVVAVTPLIGIALAPVVSGTVLSVFLLAVTFLPYPILLYLYLGPIRRAAESVPTRQRLLHWKARNVLLFVYAVVLLYILLAFAGLLTDPVLTDALIEYANLFSTAGVPLLIVYKFASFDGELSSVGGATDSTSG